MRIKGTRTHKDVCAHAPVNFLHAQRLGTPKPSASKHSPPDSPKPSPVTLGSIGEGHLPKFLHDWLTLSLATLMSHPTPYTRSPGDSLLLPPSRS